MIVDKPRQPYQHIDRRRAAIAFQNFQSGKYRSRISCTRITDDWRKPNRLRYLSLPMNLPARAGTRRSILPPGQGNTCSGAERLGRAKRGGRRREERPCSRSQFATRAPWRLYPLPKHRRFVGVELPHLRAARCVGDIPPLVDVPRCVSLSSVHERQDVPSATTVPTA